jgi:hypothetical protein
MRKFAFVTAAALVAISTAAVAAVDVDEEGYGFVGKGDVQLAFGWNDAKLQQNASGVTFKYSLEDEYKFDCTFTVEVGRDKVREPRTQNRGREVKVNASISYEARKNTAGKINGFNLNGFGSDTTTTGAAPVEGGHCTGGQFNDGVISNVELRSSTGGGLSVVYGGLAIPLPNTPVI